MAATVSSTSKGNVWARLAVCIVAGLLLLTASLGFWAKNNVINSQRFSDHVVNAVHTEPVRTAIGSAVAERLYQDRPVLGRLLSDPTKNLVSSLLLNERFSSILDNMANRLSERLFHGKTNAVVIDASGFTGGIEALAAVLRPEGELSLPQGDDAKIVLLEADTIPNFQPAAQAILVVTPLAALALVILAVAAWLMSASKLIYGKLTGLVLVATGVTMIVLTSTAASQLSLMAKNANQAVVLQSIYDEFTMSLASYQYWLIWTGIAILAISYLIQYRATIGSYARSAGTAVSSATHRNKE